MLSFYAVLLGIAYCFGSYYLFLPVLCILLGYHWKWIYIAIRTLPRDLWAYFTENTFKSKHRGLLLAGRILKLQASGKNFNSSAVISYGKILWITKKYEWKDYAAPDIFHEVVQRHPLKPCYLYENETWTYKDVEEFSLRVSAVLMKQGVKHGDTVSVILSNCPELPATWLGVARLGAISALININQMGSTLVHSINIVNSDFVIYGEAYEKTILEIAGDLKPAVKLFKYIRRPLKLGNAKSECDSTDFTSMLENTESMAWRLSNLGFSGKMLYIYTSGTTGLPKAAVMKTSRQLFMAAGMFYTSTLTSDDIIYCPMPMYHSAGGVMTIGIGLMFGCTIAIRAKFSASQYFTDCIKFNTTAAQYIGEMCRYILSTPPAKTDQKHKVRVIYGNGMRPAIWREFVERFRIKRVTEFYGATEGNANITNVDGHEGAVGFVSRIVPWIYPIATIKFDEDTGEPIRDAQGLCQPAEPNEPGVFVGKIDENNPARQYHGYADKKDTEKKIIRNVYKHGDAAFLSGDILVADELGYLYFRDRTGDTFRWKGENVSTSEVEAVISNIIGQKDAVVYGVEIPNTEGRAGMCGILDENGTVDIDKLSKDISKDLPKYAKPIFIRILSNLDMTATFKMRKVDLQKEGFDPNKLKDALYYLDPVIGKYIPLGPEKYKMITSGEIKL